MTRTLALAGTVMCVCGCALISRGQPLQVRYFTPEPPSARLGSPSKQAQGARPAVHLGRVRGAPYLHERIAYRESKYEIGFYDDREWTERPDAYVRRALVRKLFDERGFEQLTGGPGPSLDVDVLAFEELRTPSLHGARVAVRYQIRGPESVLEERTVVAERSASGQRFDDVVAAMSAALDDLTDRIADRVAKVVSP